MGRKVRILRGAIIVPKATDVQFDSILWVWDRSKWSYGYIQVSKTNCTGPLR